MVKTYAVNCNDAWLNTKGDDISGSYVKYEDYAELERRLLAAEAQEPVGWMTDVEVDELHRGVAEEAYIYRLPDSASTIPLYAAPPVAQPVHNFPETLPCPVMLEPGMRFGKGVRTQTMLDALKRRAEYYAELDAMTPEQRAEHDARLKEFSAMLKGGEHASQPSTLRDGVETIINSGIAIDGDNILAERHSLNEPVQSWIPCSERMPEREYVLAADFSGSYYLPSLPNTQVGIYADWFEDGKPSWDDGDGNDLNLKQVTHWMPLPAAPQPESD